MQNTGPQRNVSLSALVFVNLAGRTDDILLFIFSQFTFL
jgi:hypothetical protein